MKAILIIMILSLAHICLAADTDNFDETRDLISFKYVTGGYLLYDCQDQHWVCATKDNKEICDRDRESDLTLGKHQLSCLSAEIFQTYRDCKVKQLSLVKSGMKPRNCLHPSVRKRLIGFQ